ncbi:MAG: hypothetical protein ACOYO1_15535 [Bacteroidales bacterium]
MFLITNKKELFTSDHTEIIRWESGVEAGDYLCFGDYSIDNKEFILNLESRNVTEQSFAQTANSIQTSLKTPLSFFNKVIRELKNIFGSK